MLWEGLMAVPTRSTTLGGSATKQVKYVTRVVFSSALHSEKYATRAVVSCSTI